MLHDDKVYGISEVLILKGGMYFVDKSSSPQVWNSRNGKSISFHYFAEKGLRCILNGASIGLTFNLELYYRKILPLF